MERAGERLEVLTEPRGDALLEAGCEFWTNPSNKINYKGKTVTKYNKEPEGGCVCLYVPLKYSTGS